MAFAHPQSTDELVRQAQKLSIQQPSNTGGVFLVPYMVRAGLNISPWWSPSRDIELGNFWKKNDYLSGAMYVMESKMTSIPVSVQAYDQSNRDHLADAEYYTRKIKNATEFGEGWTTFFGKFVESLSSYDNGVFVEIIGPGDVRGPLEAEPVTVKLLDSNFCTRTGHPEFPVVYRDNKKSYALHRSRVMFASQMTSTIKDMNGVGFSAISRCINISQTLLDILVFKQEKLGSRPHRAILITKGGLDPEDVQKAFMAAESQLDSAGLTRYAKVVVAGSSSLQEAGIDQIELSTLPEGFDEQTSVTLGMATIALAFGVDARELFPSSSSGATRADALLQHLKQRGKGPGQILQITEDLFNYKFLPPHLYMHFDYQDDAEDRQIAEIKQIRANRWSTAIASATMDERSAREQMLEVGDLSRSQFDRLELDDGRLPDGTPILTMFYSKDAKVRRLLDLSGVSENLLDTVYNDPQTIIDAVNEKLPEIYKQMANGMTHQDRWLAQQAYYALVALKKMYESPQIGIVPADTTGATNDTQTAKPDKPVFPGKQDSRLRSRPPENVRPRDAAPTTDTMQPDSEDTAR